MRNIRSYKRRTVAVRLACRPVRPVQYPQTFFPQKERRNTMIGSAFEWVRLCGPIYFSSVPDVPVALAFAAEFAVVFVTADRDTEIGTSVTRQRTARQHSFHTHPKRLAHRSLIYFLFHCLHTFYLIIIFLPFTIYRPLRSPSNEAAPLRTCTPAGVYTS